MQLPSSPPSCMLLRRAVPTIIRCQQGPSLHPHPPAMPHAFCIGPSALAPAQSGHCVIFSLSAAIADGTGHSLAPCANQRRGLFVGSAGASLHQDEDSRDLFPLCSLESTCWRHRCYRKKRARLRIGEECVVVRPTHLGINMTTLRGHASIHATHLIVLNLYLH